MRRTLFIATIALSMLMPFANPAAEAKYPGPNGQILFARGEPPDNDPDTFHDQPGRDTRVSRPARHCC